MAKLEALWETHCPDNTPDEGEVFYQRDFDGSIVSFRVINGRVTRYLDFNRLRCIITQPRADRIIFCYIDDAGMPVYEPYTQSSVRISTVSRPKDQSIQEVLSEAISVLNSPHP